MKKTVFLLIIKITLVFSDSHNDINTIASQNNTTTIQLIPTTTQQNQNETLSSTVSNTASEDSSSSPTTTPITANSTYTISSSCSSNDITSTESTPATTAFSSPNSTLFTNESTITTSTTNSSISTITDITAGIKTGRKTGKKTDKKTGKKTDKKTNKTQISTTSSPSPHFTTSFYSSFFTDDWPNTKILTKKGLNHTDPSIKIASPADGDFQTLIQNSAFWVDKSLLIRKIWEGTWKCHVVVRAPPKWGKTINLSMIKFHCDLSLDSNGFEILKNKSVSDLYFNEGKIVMRDGTIEELDEPPLLSGYNEHLTKHPVIFISGSHLSIDNSLESFRMMIHETYQHHERLLNRYKILYSKASSRKKLEISQNMTEFQEFYNLESINQMNKTYLVRGIQILSRLLSDAYQQKVMVLFDDYDQYAQKAYFEGNPYNFTDNGTQFDNLWELFLDHTFNRNIHLEKAVLAGVLKAKDPSCLPGVPNYFNAYVFDDQDLFPYFGFFEVEFLQMATIRGLDRCVIDNATQWYGGYRTLSNLGYQMYSPYSVAQFMNTLQIQDYWPTSILSKFVKQFLRKPTCQHRFRDLIDKFGEGKVRVTPLYYETFKNMDMTDYADIQKIDLDEVQFIAGLHENEVFSLLVSSGYLAVHEHNREQIYILVRIPNREIYNQINSVIDS